MSGNICRCGAYPEHRRGDRRKPRGGHEAVRATPGPHDADGRGRARGRPRPERSSSAGGRISSTCMNWASRRPRRWSMSPACRSTDRADRRRRPAHRRGGPEQRPRRHPAVRRATRRSRRGAAGRRVRPAAEHGDDRREPAAAHALPVLPGRDEAVQQARPRDRVSRARGRAPQARDPRRTPNTASPRIRRTWRSPWPPSTRSCTSSAPAATARSRLVDFHRLPGDTPSSTPSSSRTN